MDQSVLYLDSQFQILAAQGKCNTLFSMNLERITQYTLPQLVPELVLSIAHQQLNETGQYHLHLVRMNNEQPQEWHFAFYPSPFSDATYVVNLTVIQVSSYLGLTLSQQAMVLQAMSEDQSALVLFYDLDCRIIYVNAYAQQCLGRSLTQLKGLLIFDVIDPNNVEAAKQQLNALSVDNPVLHHEYGHNVMAGQQNRVGEFAYQIHRIIDRLIGLIKVNYSDFTLTSAIYENSHKVKQHIIVNICKWFLGYSYALVGENNLNKRAHRHSAVRLMKKNVLHFFLKKRLVYSSLPSD